jgi:hypothetical protein
MVQFHKKYTNTSTCPTVITVIINDNITVQNKISKNMRLSCSITIHKPHISYKDRLDMYSRAKCTKIRKDTIQWNTALKVYGVLAGLSQDMILQHDNITPYCTVRHKICLSHCSNICTSYCSDHCSDTCKLLNVRCWGSRNGSMWINGNARAWLLPQKNYYNLCQDGTKVSMWLGIRMQKMPIQ